jgi:hypothetical protein
MDTDDKRERAMMALIQDAVQRGLDLDWDYAAKQVDPDCSGDALKQQINKRRDKLLTQGVPVGPVSSRSRHSRRNRTASNVQLQTQQLQGGTAQLVNDQGMLPHATYGDVAQLNGTASMATLTDPQTPARQKRRRRTESPETPTRMAKSYGDDEDVFLDNDDSGDQRYSDDDVSDWASGKPAKKKVKKGRSGKGSLVVKLKTSKKNQSAGASNMPMTPSTGSSTAKKVHFKEETPADETIAVSNVPLTPFTGLSAVENVNREEKKPADKAVAPRKNRTYGGSSNYYSTGVAQTPNIFTPGPSPMMHPSVNQYGNLGMMNNLTMSANSAMVNHPFGGAYGDSLISEPAFLQNRLFGMPNQVLIDTSSFHQYGNAPNFHPSGLAGYGNGLGVNYPSMSPTTGPYGQFARRASDPSIMHHRHLFANPTNINSAGPQEPSTPSPKEWDFPNARIDAPIFGDEPESTGKHAAGRKSYNERVVPIFANTLLGSFTNYDTPVAPTMPTPVSLSRQPETPSPTDSSVVSPQKLSFAHTSNPQENLAVDTVESVEKPDENMDFGGMVEFNPHDPTINIPNEQLRFSNTPVPFGY